MENIEQIENKIMKLENKITDSELCRGTASTYSRITGYYRPVECWCTGKKSEYVERLEYIIEKIYE